MQAFTEPGDVWAAAAAISGAVGYDGKPDAEAPLALLAARAAAHVEHALTVPSCNCLHPHVNGFDELCTVVHSHLAAMASTGAAHAEAARASA